MQYNMDNSQTSGKFSKISVLVIEDEMLVYFLIEDILHEVGCADVQHANNIEGAMSCIAEKRPDIAILDMNLGGRRCDPVAACLDEMGIPIIFSTGYGRADIPEHWQGRPTIEKPFTTSGFLTLLEAELTVLQSPRGSGD